ncbi:Bug family tripartite tricarboxylate transporter substrate binding protein [Sediminicoccus rosea]|uniref:Tripartite tricarboxylate transporter substrate binding protein n=1 Tax=Sediminicoccus rosea TaxID=1225128 RepID=A0ABZ0PGM0_9PROT|nr:tripartite tricarboxylate transporter substrate binding protein [Sediminicoccus rosea]WPB84280.1 tripartite tricarboxylate transporter substrate binding protein [Sediminicoccus rosea]
MTNRRQILAALAATPALAAPALAPSAQAQPARWTPSRSVRLIVPFPAGGSPDVLTRLMSAHAQAALGQNVVVENRTGAGATVGSNLVAREAPDGHTILVAVISSLTAPLMMSPPPYDPVRDFRALSMLAITPTVLVTRPDFPARTVQEWHEVIQRNPGRFTFASGGVGNPAHLAGELYRSMTGANITHVPFRGSAPALVELRAGRVDFSILDLPSAAAMIADRSVPALAVGTAERLPTLPDLPTIAESVVPGFEAYSWVMWWVPAATPDAVAQRLTEVANEALRQPDVQARAAQAGFLLRGTDQAAARAHVTSEHAKWGRIIRERNITFDG